MPFNKKKTTASAAKFAGHEFVTKVKQTSPRATSHGRRAAVAKLARLGGATQEDASAVYDALVATMSTRTNVVLNMDVTALATFLRDGTFAPETAARQEQRFNHLASKRAQAERAIGCTGLSPVYASLSTNIEGDRTFGPCSVVLSGLGERLVALCGDSARLRNQASPDFVQDPTLVLYSADDLASCRAAAAIMALPDRIVMSGLGTAARELEAADKEYGVSEAMIFGGVTTDCISRVIVDTEEAAVALRVALDQMGKLCPISVSKRPRTVYGHSADPMEPAAPTSVPQKHFSSGDRVTMKPSASNPKILGTILDVANGNVTIQWDDSQRAVYDMAEALIRVMSAPEAPKRVDGMVSYSLPGMDNDTVLALSVLGIDPVSIYTLASHGRPASPSAEWWEDRLIKSLAGLGINAYMAKGFVKNSGQDSLAFVPHKWFEARLPGGSRLVMDVGPEHLTIRAGNPEDYILPSPDSSIVFE